MDDDKIIDLYWTRSELALSETQMKYGGLCVSIASNILSNREDSEECVNDVYLALWNSIPPKRPERFQAFICRITRNLALKKFEYLTAEKRNKNAVCSIDELEYCVSGRNGMETEFESKKIETAINTFLWKQDKEKRGVFILRYWYFESIKSISGYMGFSQSKVKSILFNLRRKLRLYLESEGIEI